MFDAIILAGGAKNKQMEAESTTAFEAMIDIDGKPMVTFVARALAASKRIDRIFVIGPVVELAFCQFPANTILLASGETVLDTIEIGIKALGHQNKVLVVTADIPLLTAEAINDFINKCERSPADLCYPIVKKEIIEAYYPGNRRTYVKLREGVFTGGNIFLVSPIAVGQAIKVSAPIVKNRKNPWKLCAFLGFSIVLKYILGLLSLEDLEKTASKTLGLQGKAIESLYPEVGLDVDKKSDLQFVRAIYSN